MRIADIGFRIADWRCRARAALPFHPGAAAPIRNPQSAIRNWALKVLALTLAIAACAANLPAQDIDVPAPPDEKPNTYLTIRVESATRDWEIMPVAIKKGQSTVANSNNDLRLEREKWQMTGAVKRYNLDKWRKVFNDYTDKAPQAENAYLEFQARAPKTPTLQGVVQELNPGGRVVTYRVPCQKVKIVRYPQTWLNIYENYVLRFDGDQRRLAVKKWEETNRAIIENPEQTPAGFTAEERNEFAIFYQKQFVYVRNQNPQLAAIYQELADYHRQRGNLDAELATYLDAIENGVASPKLEEFALNAGRIFVTRLSLYREAITYLESAAAYAEARYLKARCFIELRDTVKARRTLKELLDALASPSGSLVLSLSADDEKGRANLWLARVEFAEAKYAEAEQVIRVIPAASASWQEGQVLFCAMLTARGLRDDFQKIKETLDALPVIGDAKKLLSMKPDDPLLVYPFNPLMCQALVLYAQTDSQFRQPVDTTGKAPQKPSDLAMRMIEIARAVDPLSSEPHLCEGRLKQHLGDFPGALEAYQAGLAIEPRSVRLNYAVANLKNKSGVTAEAKDLLSRCLREDASFHPALSLLGEISLAELDRLRENLISRRAAGEKVDIEAELLPPLKEAAAFFQGALEIQPDQPVVKLSLASLYLQLAEISPATINSKSDAEDVRRAYLVKSRDLAMEMVAVVRKLGERPSVDELATAEEVAATPTPACFNVYAFACYSLGDFAAARAALEEHLAIIRGVNARKHFANSKALSEYRGSPSVAYAERWLAAIRANERQYVERDDFEGAFDKGFYGAWNICNEPKADLGFMKSDACGIKDGKLTVGLGGDKGQQESYAVSRIAIPKSFQTLTRFTARFARKGDLLYQRGIFLSRMTTNTGKPTASPVNTVMLGIDSAGQIYWQVRRFKLDNQAKQEEIVAGDLIDIRKYNGPIDKTAPISLGLLRRVSEDRSYIVFVAVINGYEVELPLPEGLDDVRRNDVEDKSLRMDCGFFAWGLAGAVGEFSIDSTEFVFDSGLGKQE